MNVMLEIGVARRKWLSYQVCEYTERQLRCYQVRASGLEPHEESKVLHAKDTEQATAFFCKKIA